MYETITYSLRDHQKDSDQYYRDVSAFTDRFIEYARQHSESKLQAFHQYTAANPSASPRTIPEYVLEFLLLGMLFKLYAAETEQMAAPTRRTLTWLADIRERYTFLEPAADALKGVLSGLLVRPGQPDGKILTTLVNFENLLDWLRATGEFHEEVKRLTRWRDFLKTLEPETQSDILKQAVSLAKWFTGKSLVALGKYTQNVDEFLANTHPSYQWREDRFFCGRQREEYHMNMVGTEILNRAFREPFLDTGSHIVLLPPCMKAKQDDTCQAVETDLGERCGHCTPGCRVHQITLLGDKHGFLVRIIPHELSVFSSGKIEAPNEHTVGIVGVSCPLTNVTGGWETQDLSIPAQGVLLDYCGCRWHWHPDGIPTDINIRQLLKVLAE